MAGSLLLRLALAEDVSLVTLEENAADEKGLLVVRRPPAPELGLAMVTRCCDGGGSGGGGRRVEDTST